MGKQIRIRPVPVDSEFDYGSLKLTEAEKIRRTAKVIKEKIGKSLQNLIDAGKGLLTVKRLLRHGQFGAWLKVEFGWAERTARNLMAVAEVFASKTATIADMDISPTALYVLAAPSTPFEARQTAIDRAQAGEKITPAIVTEIIRVARKKAPQKLKALPPDKLARRLRMILKRFRERCEPGNMLEYARHLRQYASDLEKECRAAIGPAQQAGQIVQAS